MKIKIIKEQNFEGDGETQTKLVETIWRLCIEDTDTWDFTTPELRLLRDELIKLKLD